MPNSVQTGTPNTRAETSTTAETPRHLLFSKWRAETLQVRILPYRNSQEQHPGDGVAIIPATELWNSTGKKRSVQTKTVRNSTEYVGHHVCTRNVCQANRWQGWRYSQDSSCGEMKRHERPRVVPWTDMMGDQPIVGEISVPRKANIYESIPCCHTDFVDT